MKECPQCGRKEESEFVEHICSKCDLALDASTFVARLHLRKLNSFLQIVVFCFALVTVVEYTTDDRFAAMQLYLKALLVLAAVGLLVRSFFSRTSMIIINRDYVRIVHPDFGQMDIRYERIGRVEIHDDGDKTDKVTIYGIEGEQLLSLDRDHPRGMKLVEECAIEVKRRLEAWRERNTDGDDSN